MSKNQQMRELDQSREKFTPIQTPEYLNAIVYSDGNWKTRDILVNIAFWEFEGAKSVLAFLDGAEYHPPNFSEALVEQINDAAYQKFCNQPDEAIVVYFAEGRRQMVDALERVSAEQFDQPMMCPWAMRETVAEFVREMILHEQDHLRDILEVIG